MAKFESSSLFKDESVVDPSCTAEESLTFIQFSCEQTAERLEQKSKDLSIISCLGIFCASIFSVAIYYQKRDSKMEQLDWDIQTITPGDYSV